MRKLYKVLGGILVLLALLLSSCAGDTAGRTADHDSGAEEAASKTPAEAEPPSEAEPSVEPITFEGTDLEGNTVSSEIFSQSKLTMVNVWATYCGPCLREMPSLGELSAEYDAEDFQIMGIISDVQEGEDQSYAESLIQQTGANYIHLLLNESIYYALLTDVTAVPTTFFLDTDGIVLDVVVGAGDKTTWEEIINELLEGL